MITTLVLQICLYFSGIYLVVFAVAEFSIQTYKWLVLPYATGTLISELVLFLLLLVVESLRIQLGKRGNLTNQTVPLVASLLLIAPSLLAVLHCLLWQSYVLRVEIIACGVQIGIHSLTFIIFVIKIMSVLTQPSL